MKKWLFCFVLFFSCYRRVSLTLSQYNEHLFLELDDIQHNEVKWKGWVIESPKKGLIITLLRGNTFLLRRGKF